MHASLLIRSVYGSVQIGVAAFGLIGLIGDQGGEPLVCLQPPSDGGDGSGSSPAKAGSDAAAKAPAAWEALRESAQKRLESGGEAALREVLNDLLAFEETNRGTLEGAIALFNHGQLSAAIGELDAADASLRRAREAATDPQLLAAINQALAQVALRPGANPPKFTATTLDGREISPGDYKGKVLLLDFWATWCGPCIAELPNVQRVYKEFHEKGLEIVSISLDRAPEPLEKFLERESLPWTHVLNAAAPREEDPASIYGVTAIPTMILIGRDGRIADVNMRGPRLEEAVERAIKANAAEAAPKDPDAPDAEANAAPIADKVDPASLDIGRPRGPKNPDLGILDSKAPAWRVEAWHNLPDGRKSIDLDDYRGKVVYLYGFQSWCPGCHKYGFPTLQELTRRFKDQDDVAFVAVQTTFEGFEVNTSDKALETVRQYALDIPVGHSGRANAPSPLMRDYRGGGTPWTVIIDREGVVRFNDFHITPDEAHRLINQLRDSAQKP